MDGTLTDRLADRLKALRRERGLSLDALAAASGISRATLSRLENAEVSPTAEALGKLCSVYALTMSRLLAMVEQGFRPLLRRADQDEWTDPDTGFVRRAISPPAAPLAGEVIEGWLPPGARIAYDAPSVPGLEHHLVMRDGGLELEVNGETHDLRPGDCLRYRLHGASEFRADAEIGARYLLVLI